MGGYFSSVFGSKPKVPEWKPLNIDKEQKDTVTGNLEALGEAETLGSRVNTFNQQELERLYGMALPSYDKIKESVSKSLGDLSAGKIPDDVASEVLRRAAGRSYAGGFGGTGLSRNLQARDLGLTSLDLMDRGLGATQRWLSTATAPRFDVTSMFLTPSQRIPIAAEERNLQWQYEYLKNQIKAMPDPQARGAHDAVVTLLQGAGNMWGANYNTQSAGDFGKQSYGGLNTGGSGGGYMPQQNYYGSGSNSGQYGQGAAYEDAAYGSGGANGGSGIGGSGMDFGDLTGGGGGYF